MNESYAPPVDTLLTLGDVRGKKKEDYLALGLGPEHIPELIRMLQDEDLHTADSGSAEVWAPLHAWRALGQLRAEAAIEPLLGQLYRIDDFNDDWVAEDMPDVLAEIGPAATEPTIAYLADIANPLWARVAAVRTLRKIAGRYPDERQSCVRALMAQLEHCSEQDPSLNAFLVDALTELKATEAAPLIKRAFDASTVDELVRGGWSAVRRDLGLAPKKKKRTKKRKKRR